MNDVSISGWVRSAPVVHRLGQHAVYTEFRLGIAPPERNPGDAAVVVFCHGRLAQYAHGHLDVGDLVEIHGFLFVAADPSPDADSGDRVSVIADRVGVPGEPSISHRPPHRSDLATGEVNVSKGGPA
ncbi:MAG: hypothetical protein QM733_04415 [Ilumatobacteraceae bacterium]